MRHPILTNIRKKRKKKFSTIGYYGNGGHLGFGLHNSIRFHDFIYYQNFVQFDIREDIVNILIFVRWIFNICLSFYVTHIYIYMLCNLRKIQKSNI